MKLYCDRCLGGDKWFPPDKALKWMRMPGHQPVIPCHSSRGGGGGRGGDFQGKLPGNTSFIFHPVQRSARHVRLCGSNATPNSNIDRHVFELSLRDLFFYFLAFPLRVSQGAAWGGKLSSSVEGEEHIASEKYPLPLIVRLWSKMCHSILLELNYSKVSEQRHVCAARHYKG